MCVKHIRQTIKSNRTTPLLRTSSRALEFVTMFVCDVAVVKPAPPVLDSEGMGVVVEPAYILRTKQIIREHESVRIYFC
jgi:hypothetical protein